MSQKCMETKKAASLSKGGQVKGLGKNPWMDQYLTLQPYGRVVATFTSLPFITASRASTT